MRARTRSLAVFLLCFALPGVVNAKDIAVSPGPGVLAAAIANAQPGDVLRLATGDYDGPVVIDKPLTLSGDSGARIVGPGMDTVIRVLVGPSKVEGLVITGSGKKLNNLDAGVAIARGSDGVQVLDNRILGNLIGVDVQGGLNVVVRGNTIEGRSDLHKADLGPGVYVWNAPGLLVENNTISRGRDGVFISTSNKAVYRNNTFTDLRFAMHSMNSNNIEVTGNVSHDNDMGFAFMYSRNLVVTGNRSTNDRTHGIFLNFANRATITHNEVRDGGEKCLFVYNSNMNRITDNLFEGCDIGVHFTAGSDGNDFSGNAFIANRTQVKYVATRWMDWSTDGRGNFWSDHPSFDIDGDGIADSPYRPNDSIDRIVWSQPIARLLLGSPGIQLIRWSQSRFPGLLPGGVIDNFPLTSPSGAGVPRDDAEPKGAPA